MRSIIRIFLNRILRISVCSRQILPLLLLSTFSVSAYTGEIHLKNGDRISGKIIREDASIAVIDTNAAGRLHIEKKFIEKIEPDKKKEVASKNEAKGEEGKSEKACLWEGKFSLGADESGGNTKTSQLNVSGSLNRKTDSDEFTASGSAYYGSSNKKMDTQEWRALLRYAVSFKNKSWYRFVKIEGDHDRFNDIGYRLVPSLGAGYWFSDQEDFKALLECGLGYEHTSYRSGGGDKSQTVLIPRIFLDKKLIGNLRVSENLKLYPSLSYGGQYRLYSETSLINPINEKLALRFTLIEEYDSNPLSGVKKNDYRVITALDYSF
ncbi:MAG: DUF481 domain-containing protein [Candidatus Omnitrophica bacterium]|nr:DUF481 domain-containing protein [Candidatus Omnitrophota bacterium]MDD5429285.1 DUF481 domain-containing protein [Candidatus Omnitrophota bacterium]